MLTPFPAMESTLRAAKADAISAGTPLEHSFSDFPFTPASSKLILKEPKPSRDKLFKLLGLEGALHVPTDCPAEFTEQDVAIGKALERREHCGGGHPPLDFNFEVEVQ